MIKIKLAITSGLLMGAAALCSAGYAEVDCGMAGDEGSIPGTNFAGYWRTLFGTMRLVRIGNMLEGPSSASGYLKGSEAGNTFQGRFAEDTGQYHTGNFTITMSQEGRCMKGRMVYDDGTLAMELLGYRIKYPGMPYREYYELTNRTEDLKRLVGGILSFDQIDGPDTLAGAPQTSTPSFAPSLPAVGSHPPNEEEVTTDTPEEEELETEE